jgi:hypothetical protein
LLRVVRVSGGPGPGPGASVVPLTLLVLALDFVVMVAVVWPTPERQAMVDKLAGAMRDVGLVIAGRPPESPGKITAPRDR